MADLTRYYVTALNQHRAGLLVLISLTMLDFLRFHSFPDGNVTLLQLYRFDHDAVISLERNFEQAKEGLLRAFGVEREAPRIGIKGCTMPNLGLTISEGFGPTASSSSVLEPSSMAEVAWAQPPVFDRGD
ncbi:hypothetical protein [Burkholderia sp. BE12]|uniref:hypothetical protein n=1 Tax=Burkholderia sp. BE12 TaxID=2082394 RepID=UPI00131A02AD|nr:hypothetical protein [Burkholderia sp. BE12]